MYGLYGHLAPARSNRSRVGATDSVVKLVTLPDGATVQQLSPTASAAYLKAVKGMSFQVQTGSTDKTQICVIAAEAPPANQYDAADTIRNAAKSGSAVLVNVAAAAAPIGTTFITTVDPQVVQQYTNVASGGALFALLDPAVAAGVSTAPSTTSSSSSNTGLIVGAVALAALAATMIFGGKKSAPPALAPAATQPNPYCHNCAA